MSHLQKRPDPRQPFSPDPFDLRQLIDRPVWTVLPPPLDDPLRQGFPDARETLELFNGCAVQVKSRETRALIGGRLGDDRRALR